MDLAARANDASILSDEATAPGLANFTGAFVGMCCQISPEPVSRRIRLLRNTGANRQDPVMLIALVVPRFE
jgi:hypothetical protein